MFITSYTAFSIIELVLFEAMLLFGEIYLLLIRLFSLTIKTLVITTKLTLKNNVHHDPADENRNGFALLMEKCI